MKKLLIFGIVFLILGVVGIYLLKFQASSQQSAKQSEMKERLEPEIWEDLASSEPLSSYQIKDIEYYGETGKCYAAGAMGLLKHWGVTEQEVQKYWQWIQENGRGGPPDFAFALKELGYSEYLYFAYAKNYDYDPRVIKALNHNVKNPEKQIKLFENKDEAVSYLKKIISLHIPVMIAVREKMLDGSLGGADFILVYGYDEKNIYYYKLPKVKDSSSIEDLLQRWELGKEKDFQSQFPGNYNIIFLKPKGD